MNKLAPRNPSPRTGPAPWADHRRKLLEKRRELMDAMGMKFDAMAGSGRVGEEDQAQISHDEFISLRLNKLDYDALRLVNEALDRLDNGDYGDCPRCEDHISPRRLEVLPWAKYCVRCQEKLARRQHDFEEADLAATSAW